MAKGHYTIEGKNIIADVAKLTAKELAAVMNYQKLGYTLVEKKKEKKTVKEAFTSIAIQAWMNDNATEEQRKEYWKIYNTPVYVRDSEGNKTAETVKLKSGKEKKQGHVACISWFKEQFPQYPTDADNEAAKAAIKAASAKE